MYKNITKPFFDFLIALIGLIILLPFIILIITFLTFSNNGKPFFYQIRPGKNEKLFRIIKFKTMNDKTDNNGELLPDEKRLTPIGMFVRKTSLDEIPQLINVIKGNMSLIGPRPLLPEYLDLYSKEQHKRHNVKPGITGWAQINGRNAISWEHKFKLDVWYVENISFKLDIKILFLTLRKIIIKEGITSSTSVTMEKFKG